MIDFFAPVNESSPETAKEELVYNYKAYGNGLDLLKKGLLREFAEL